MRCDAMRCDAMHSRAADRHVPLYVGGRVESALKGPYEQLSDRLTLKLNRIISQIRCMPLSRAQWSRWSLGL